MSCCMKSRADLLCDETMLLFAEICDAASIKVDMKLVRSFQRGGINRLVPYATNQSKTTTEFKVGMNCQIGPTHNVSPQTLGNEK